jgi:hypothetical protein
VEGQGLTKEGCGDGLVWMPVESDSDTRTFLWSPPPAAADVAMEEVREVSTQASLVVPLCPRLMTPWWRCPFCREANFQFEIPVGSDVWPELSHEPLLVSVFLPFVRHRPWKLRGTPKLLGMEQML